MSLRYDPCQRNVLLPLRHSKPSRSTSRPTGWSDFVLPETIPIAVVEAAGSLDSSYDGPLPCVRFNLSAENCVAFLDPLIECWDIDLASFGMEIVLNRRLAPSFSKKFEFVEREPDQPFEEEPGLKEFLGDPHLSGDAAQEEIEFLKRLRFKGRRPTSLYYYRELQSLRDPLHFRGPATANATRRA